MTTVDLTPATDLLERLGVEPARVSGGDLVVRTPITGEEIGRVERSSRRGYGGRRRACQRRVRGMARRPGAAARRAGAPARRGAASREGSARALVTLETGKIAQEGLGEVQEMIDICDFAVGLSRQLYGRSIASERPGHRLTETWHPLGSGRGGQRVQLPGGRVELERRARARVRRPRDLEAVRTDAAERRSPRRRSCPEQRTGSVDVPDGLFELVVGGADRALQLADDPRIPLVSATGSTVMGKALAPRVAARLGRSLLELGGNNAAIVAPSADLDLVVRGVLFAAVGTAGQRCTSLRRLIVHESIVDELVGRLASSYRSISIGDPREPGVLVGPLISGESFGRMEAALGEARARRWRDRSSAESVCSPIAIPMRGTRSRRIVRMPAQTAVVQQETFAPILYVLTYDDARRGDRTAERRPSGPGLVDLHERPTRSRAVPRRCRLRLRDRERQHRPERRRDRRRVRRREGDGRRTRVGLRRLEGVHAPPDCHRQLHERAPARAGHRLRHPLTDALVGARSPAAVASRMPGSRRCRVAIVKALSLDALRNRADLSTAVRCGRVAGRTVGSPL